MILVIITNSFNSYRNKQKFDIKYNVTNILDKILIPTQTEIKKLFDAGLSPRFFTYQERRELVGKCKKLRDGNSLFIMIVVQNGRILKHKNHL